MPLNNKVLQVIRATYGDLALDELLERSLGAYIQSNNENLNSLIWI